jgi:hypothetical protein
MVVVGLILMTQKFILAISFRVVLQMMEIQ